MRQFVLFNAASGGYIGLSGLKPFLTGIEGALVFDERDNMGMKARFYKAICGGVDLEVKEI